MDLFGGDASEEDEKLEVNKEFAEQYESRKRKQALQKAKEQGKLDVDSDEETSSEEDSDADILTPRLDLKIAKTIQAIREKDPKIYDRENRFFEEEEDEEDEAPSTRKEKTRKPYKIADHLRDEVLDGVEGREQAEEEEVVVTHEDELAALKKGFLDAADVSDDEDEDADEGGGFGLRARKKSKAEEEKEEEEFNEFVAANQKNKVTKEEKKALERFYDKSSELNPTEKFLWEYIKNEGWMDKEADTVPTYNQIVEEDSEEDDKVRSAL